MLGLLGRLLYPNSEKKTAEWLNENSAAMELYCPESGAVDRNRLMQKYVHNKQKRSDCRQITLGLLADQDGFVKHSHYYAGQRSQRKGYVRKETARVRNWAWENLTVGRKATKKQEEPIC